MLNVRPRRGHVLHWAPQTRQHSRCLVRLHIPVKHSGSTNMKHKHVNLNWIKPLCLCLQSSFVVRQNSRADVAAVVITLGLTGSRWLSSYKLRGNTDIRTTRNRHTKRCRKRGRMGDGGNQSRHNAIVLNGVTETERTSETYTRGKHRWNNTHEPSTHLLETTVQFV